MSIFDFLKKKEELSAEQIYQKGKYQAHVVGDFKEAFKLYSQATKMGLKEAQYDLAVLYFYGKGVPVDRKRTAELIKPLADKMMPEAEELLAVMYYNGVGVERNIDEAWKYFQKGIVLENPEALLYGGLCLVNSGSVDAEKAQKIVKYWTKAAELGNATAMLDLGLLYHDGIHVEEDYKEAFRWFSQAADQNEPGGVFQLGLYYHDGLGVEKDIDKAISYYQKGISLGDMACAHNLGMLYLGMNRKKEAYEIFKMAADQGFKPSKDMLDSMQKTT